MVTNPMQRKARNSFLLGMSITLLIAAAIIAVLIMQINKMKKEQEEIVKINVLTLTEDVKSGQILTSKMFKTVNIDQTVVPNNAKEAYSDLVGYFLEDEEGNEIQTLTVPLRETPKGKEDTIKQLYISSYRGETDKIQEIYTDKETNKTFMMVNGQRQEVQSNNILSDDDGDYIYLSEENANRDDHIAVYVSSTGRYYRYKMVRNANGEYVREAVYFEPEQTAMVAKVNMNKNTVMTLQLVAKADEQISSDTRTTEINTVLLPANIQDGEHIDVRLRLPTGEDYIVVAKKEIELLPLADSYSENTMYLKLNETEIETLSNAIVEAAMIEGAYLYANKYVEAGMQEQPSATYVPSYNVVQAINTNPNLTNESKQVIVDRYNAYASTVRGRVEGNFTEDAFDNAYDGIEEEVATKQEQRKQYLDSLS